MRKAGDQRLVELGLELPPVAAPIANYVPYVLMGGTLIISGQLPLGMDGKIAPAHMGKLGRDAAAEAGAAAARQCALNILAQARAALGCLDRLTRCVRLGGFINCSPEFDAMPLVMNGASDLMTDVLGDAGRHARTTIGVAQLPLNAAVEVEAMFLLAP